MFSTFCERELGQLAAASGWLDRLRAAPQHAGAARPLALGGPNTPASPAVRHGNAFIPARLSDVASLGAGDRSRALRPSALGRDAPLRAERGAPGDAPRRALRLRWLLGAGIVALGGWHGLSMLPQDAFSEWAIDGAFATNGPEILGALLVAALHPRHPAASLRRLRRWRCCCRSLGCRSGRRWRRSAPHPDPQRRRLLFWWERCRTRREERLVLAALLAFLAANAALFAVRCLAAVRVARHPPLRAPRRRDARPRGLPWAGPGALWTRGVVAYAFGQALHYLIWLRMIPDQALYRPVPVSFRASLQLLIDFGRRGCCSSPMHWSPPAPSPR